MVAYRKTQAQYENCLQYMSKNKHDAAVSDRQACRREDRKADRQADLKQFAHILQSTIVGAAYCNKVTRFLRKNIQQSFNKNANKQYNNRR